MNKILDEYALQIAEGYIAFMDMHDWYEDVMRPEAYAKGIINNDTERIIARVVEILQDMEVE